MENAVTAPGALPMSTTPAFDRGVPTPSRFWDRRAADYAKKPVADEQAYEQTLHRVRAHLAPARECARNRLRDRYDRIEARCERARNPRHGLFGGNDRDWHGEGSHRRRHQRAFPALHARRSGARCGVVRRGPGDERVAPARRYPGAPRAHSRAPPSGRALRLEDALPRRPRVSDARRRSRCCERWALPRT